MYSRDELFLHSLECYFGVYFPRCFTTWEINTKITLSWALKQFITRVHTLFSIYMTIYLNLRWKVGGTKCSLCVLCEPAGLFDYFHIDGLLQARHNSRGLAQRPVTWSFDVSFDLCLNKQLSAQSRCRWFEMPSCSLWCYCNHISSSCCNE